MPEEDDGVRILSGILEDNLIVRFIVEQEDHTTQEVSIGAGVGDAGPAGEDGASAYEVAVANGFVGSEEAWLDSLVGEAGPQGETGPSGETPPGSLAKRFIAGLVRFGAAASGPIVDAVGSEIATAMGGTTSIVHDADAHYSNHQASAGGTAGFNAAQTVGLAASHPKLGVKFRTVEVAAVRIWVAMYGSSSASAMDSTATPNTPHAGFRYDTGVDGTAFWRCCVGTATALQTVVATTVPVTANTTYELVVEVLTGSTKFYINGDEVAEITTNQIPAATGLSVLGRIADLSGTIAKSLRWNRWEVTSD